MRAKRTQASRPARRRALAALAASPFALAAPAAAADGTRLKVLRYAFPIAETGFDPAQLTDLYSRIVTAHVFDGLYTYDHLARPFKIKPNTAAARTKIATSAITIVLLFFSKKFSVCS